MVKALALVLFAVELGAGFGTASAELVSTSSNAVEVDIRVEVVESAESVIAHLVFEDEPELVLPLLQREAGVFGIRTELKRVNYQVVFELLGPDPQQSQPHSLMALGLEIEGESVGTTTTSGPSSGAIDEASNWLWLALAFGAAALSALAFWVLGGDDQSSSDTDSTGADGDESLA